MMTSARSTGGRSFRRRATVGVAALTIALVIGVGGPTGASADQRPDRRPGHGRSLTGGSAAALAGSTAPSWAHRPVHHPAARPRVAISLSVTPSSGLTGPTIVVGTATGLTPGSYYGFGQCSQDGGVCDGSPLAPADTSGTVVIRGLARSVIDLWYWPGPPPVVDCRAEACQMILVDSGYTTIASAPITFAPGASGEPSRGTVTPDDHLVDGQVVTVDVPVGNFFPNTPMNLLECIDNIDLEFLCESGGGHVGVPASPIDGSISTTWSVQASLIGIPEEPTIDCTTGSCALWLSSPAFGPIESFPLSFGGVVDPTTTTTTSPATTSTSTPDATTTAPGSSTVPSGPTVPLPTVFTTTTSSTTAMSSTTSTPDDGATAVAGPPSTSGAGSDGSAGSASSPTTSASGTDSGPPFGAVAGASGSAPAAVAVSGPAHFTG